MMMKNADKNPDYVPVTTRETTITSASQAIVKLTQHYQDATLKYTQGIQNYNLQIEQMKNRIAEALEENKEEEEIFSKIENEVNYHARSVRESNDVLHQDIGALEALEKEYKDVMDLSTHRRIVTKKKHALKKSLDKIEEQEETLLSQELERLNILEILTPKRAHVRELQSQLKNLELEKKHYESTKLQQVIQLPTLSTTNSEELIEIDAEEA